MEHKGSRYLVFCRGLSSLVCAACSVIICVLGLVSAYAVYDGLLANREPAELDELRAQLGEESSFSWAAGMVAWLRIDGTHIDHPVMQARDNKWYLTRDYLGRDAVSGSVFLDYRNSADFGDGLSIIYGHRMNGDLMFSDIAKFADSGFFLSHRSGRLITPVSDVPLIAIEHRVLSAEDDAYRGLSKENLGLGDGRYLLLSTCNRSGRMKRDVLVMKIVQ